MTSPIGAFTAIFPHVLIEDFARYVIGAGGVHLIVNLALGRVLAARQIRSERPGWSQIRRELAASLRTVLIFAMIGTIVGVGYQAGLTAIYLDIADYGVAWLLASLAILIVAHDAWFYWAHRLMHHRRLFRWVHRLHHRSHNPTSFTAYSFNAGEAVVQAIYLPLILLVLPSHPLALFLFTTHMILRNAVGHCGVELFPARADGRPLIGWMTTVTHHDLHHAHPRWNMALYFTWWDRICGTEHPRYVAEFARVARRVPPQRITGAIGIGVVAVSLLLVAQPVFADTPASGPRVICPDGRQCLDDLRPRIAGLFP